MENLQVSPDELLKMIGEREVTNRMLGQEVGKLRAEVTRLRADLAEATKHLTVPAPPNGEAAILAQ